MSMAAVTSVLGTSGMVCGSNTPQWMVKVLTPRLLETGRHVGELFALGIEGADDRNGFHSCLLSVDRQAQCSS